VLLTPCFASLSPAPESLRVNLAAPMKAVDGWSCSGRASGRGHGFLVAAQAAMCLMLLVTAGLFLRAQQPGGSGLRAAAGVAGRRPRWKRSQTSGPPKTLRALLDEGAPTG